MTSYDRLLEMYQEMELIRSISSVLYWDTNTSLPPMGLEHRSKQAGYLEELAHRIQTSETYGQLLQEAKSLPELSDLQKRDIEILERSFLLNTALSPEFVRQQAKQFNTTLEVWKKAKSKQNFDIVRTDLEKSFQLVRQRGEKFAQALGLNDPFDALLSSREPGLNAQFVAKTFEHVKKDLVAIVASLSPKFEGVRTDFLSIQVPKHIQQSVVEAISDIFQYPYRGSNAMGRIDEVEHPLTIGCGPKDVRITVKYDESNFTRSIFAGCHELGHAIDRLGRNPDWEGHPTNSFRTPSIAECYSRFTENKIGKSQEFWEGFYPTLQKLIGSPLKNIELDEFLLATNRIIPHPSRMKADEVTYLLHIIIRFEIEQMLFNGDIQIHELPQVWNQKYHDYMGVEVQNDTEGVMQDLHWYSTYWAYFQGYGLGDIMGSQMFYAMTKEIGDWRAELRKGSLKQGKEWLELKAFRLAGYFDPLDLIESITKEKLNPTYHVRYLKEKYQKLI